MPAKLPTDKLEIYRGTAGGFTLVFQDSAGSPINLTGRTFRAEIRDTPEGELLLALTCEVIDAPAGVLNITWTAEQTADVISVMAAWGLIDDLDQLWIEDTCSILPKTPASTPDA